MINTNKTLLKPIDKPIHEVKKLALKYDLDMGLLFKYAYMTHTQIPWEFAQDFWDPRTNQSAVLKTNPHLHGFMKRVEMFPQHAVLFDRIGMNESDFPWHAPFGVVQGHTVFQISDNYTFPAASGRDVMPVANRDIRGANPGSFAKIECNHDCL